MSKNKDKGTWAESAVAYYLQRNGWPSAERRALRGNKDQGDITGTPGVCWEVKYIGRSSRVLMKPWMAELQVEMINCNVDIGLLVMKTEKFGGARTGDWYASMPVTVHDRLWERAASNGLRPVPGVPRRYIQCERNMALVRTSPEVLAHVHTYSPGYSFQADTHYRTMVLRDAVTLLRCAGYGDPVEPGEPIP